MGALACDDYSSRTPRRQAAGSARFGSRVYCPWASSQDWRMAGVLQNRLPPAVATLGAEADKGPQRAAK